MNSTSAVLLALALAVAVGDWVAAHLELRPLEYVCKPGVMVLLIGVASTLEPEYGPARAVLIGALTFSLAGDVFLMLPDRKRWFVFGLGSFLLAHLCFIPVLFMEGVTLTPIVIGLVVVLGGAATVGLRVMASVKQDRPKLLLPVQGYMGVLGLMSIVAIGTGRPAAALGGALFFASDSTLAWNEFVAPVPYGRIIVHVTYHLAQVGLVLSLL